MTKILYFESDEPNIYPRCKLTSYQDEINSLKETIKTLSDELTYVSKVQGGANRHS